MKLIFCSAALAMLQADTPNLGPPAGPLEVRAWTSGMVTTSNTLTVSVELRNVSTTMTLTVDSVVSGLPEALTLGFRKPEVNLIESGESIVLPPGVSTSRDITYPATKFHADPFASLGYRCGEHQVRVRTTYRVGGPNAANDGINPLSTIVEVAVQPRAGLAAVITGGVAGVLLASVLAFLHRKVKQQSDSPLEDSEKGSTRSVRPSREALTFVYGVAVTTAAIYLLQATTVPGFPLSVSLCDPLGGLILGLFFRPVGKFIQDRTG